MDTIEIITENDSLVYLKAFDKYCVSQKANALINKQLKTAGIKDSNKDELH